MAATQRFVPPALSRGVFGWDACRLADEYQPSELGAAAVQMLQAPENANPEHGDGRSIYLLTKKARKQVDALSWAIFYQKQAKSRADRAA
jgi:hypothetical protein